MSIAFQNVLERPRQAQYFLIFCLFAFVTGVLEAQTPDPTPVDVPQPGVRPPLGSFPRFEDWSFLRDPAKRVDPYDRLKFISLNDSGTNYLTLGLENRTEFQYLNSSNWGAGPQDHSGYVLERLMPDADLRLGDHTRVFLTLAFDDVGHKKAGPRPGIDNCFSVVASREVTLGGMGRSSRMTRRDFIAIATLVFVAPAIHVLPSQQPSSPASQSRVVFMIRGWSVQDDRAGANQVWITVSNSWRTAWR